MATINGTGDNDVLFGTSEVFDDIRGNNGDDILWGGPDESGENTGMDALIGGLGDDTLYGGDGDDFLTGDGVGGDPGSDTFGFSFTLEQESGGGGGNVPLSYADWLAANHPDLDIDALHQNQFSKTYTKWLKYLVDGWLAEAFGLDGGCDGNIKVGMKQNKEGGYPKIEGMTQDELEQVFGPAESIEVITGRGHGHHHHGHGYGHGKHGHDPVTHERFYSDINPDFFDTGSGETSLSSNDGNDIITDFQKELDTIKFTVDVPDDFSGSDADLLAFFTVDVGDFSPFGDQTADDTKISLIDDVAMSVTLQDVTFAADDSVWNYVEFQYV